MNEIENQDNPISDDQKPVPELSPDEKLDDESPSSDPIPGAQNPDSEEIKKEINPNTE